MVQHRSNLRPGEYADAILTLSLAAFVGLIGYITYKTWRLTVEDVSWHQFILSHSELGDLNG